MQSFALVSLPVVLTHIIGVTLGVNSHESILLYILESRIFWRWQNVFQVTVVQLVEFGSSVTHSVLGKANDGVIVKSVTSY